MEIGNPSQFGTITADVGDIGGGTLASNLLTIAGINTDQITFDGGVTVTANSSDGGNFNMPYVAATFLTTFCSGTIGSGTGYAVTGTQVVGGQGAAVADATGAGDVVAQLNALLARLRTHGLIAT